MTTATETKEKATQEKTGEDKLVEKILEQKTEKTKATEHDGPPKPEMPWVEVGEMVHWFPDGDRSLAPFAAEVLKVDRDKVTLSIVSAYGGSMPRDGVPHISDHKAVELDAYEGAWEHRPSRKKEIDFFKHDWRYYHGVQVWR